MEFETLSLSSYNDIKTSFIIRTKARSDLEKPESEFAWFSNSFCKHFVNIYFSAFPSTFFTILQSDHWLDFNWPDIGFNSFNRIM